MSHITNLFITEPFLTDASKTITTHSSKKNCNFNKPSTISAYYFCSVTKNKRGFCNTIPQAFALSGKQVSRIAHTEGTYTRSPSVCADHSTTGRVKASVNTK